MNALRVLQQAYSCEPCFLVYDGKPVSIDGYVVMIEGLLGEKLELRNGEEVWPMFRFFHESPDYEDVNSLDVWRCCFDHHNNTKEMMVAINLHTESISLTEETEEISRENYRSATYVMKSEYLYRLLLWHKDEENFEDWLKTLVSSELEERTRMSAREDEYGMLAELSCMFPSQVVLN